MIKQQVLKQQETMAILDSIGENIFIADTDYKLVWMNVTAHHLIDRIKEDIHIIKSDDILGMHLSTFHNEFSRTQNILENHLPYEIKIHLFDKYTAEIIVTELKNEDSEKVGYVLVWNDVTDQESKQQQQQKLMEELMTPILPMLVDDSILVPLIGTYDEYRMELLQRNLLQECSRLGTDFVVFDFSSMSLDHNEVLVSHINLLAKTVSLLGAESVFVGFPVYMVKQFVQEGLRTNIKTFPSFKQATAYLLKKKNLQVVKIE